MYEKHYVLQFEPYPHSNHWYALSHIYKTAEQAEAVRQSMPTPSLYRVAESYVVIRYKAVKA